MNLPRLEICSKSSPPDASSKTRYHFSLDSKWSYSLTVAAELFTVSAQGRISRHGSTRTDVRVIQTREDVDLVDDGLQVPLERLLPDHLDGDLELPADLLRVRVVRVILRRSPCRLLDPVRRERWRRRVVRWGSRMRQERSEGGQQP